MLRIITHICWITAILWMAAPVFCAGAQSPAKPPPPVEKPWRVAELKFKGFDNLDISDVRDVMETKGPGYLFFKPKPIFDPLRLAGDEKRILQLYREHGYFDATIKTDVKKNPGNRTVVITLTAHEQQPVIIREITLQMPSGWQGGYWEARLRQVIPIKTGQPFSLERYQESKALIRRTLEDDGHPLNTLQGQVQVHPKKLRAEVLLKIDAGPRMRFGQTSISGNEDIGKNFIRMHKMYARGEFFSRGALQETQKKLLDTGFFTTVVVEPDLNHAVEDRVPVRIVVQERPMHSVRLGVGWGTEEQLRLRILQSNRNMLGLDETFTIEGKVSSLYEGMVGRILVPYLFNMRSDLLLAGGLQQRNNEAFRNRRLFFSPMIEFRQGRHWSWFLGYNMEKNRMLELKTVVPEPEKENQTRFISSIPLAVQFDDRDSVLNPKKGTFMRADMEVSSDDIGSEVEFLRPRAEVRHIFPLGELVGKGQWYFAGRAQLGLCLPLEGTDRIPLIRRFFPGGADSVRGYPYQRLGPLDSAGKPLGGEAMVVGNLELRFPLWKEIRGVFFVDFGNAYEKYEEFESLSLRYTSGFGLRYETPVGPLRVDWGYQLNPPDDAPIPRHEFYLSVGQAF